MMGASTWRVVRIDDASDQEIEVVAVGLTREAAVQICRSKVGRDGLADGGWIAPTYCVAQVER